MSPVPTPLLAAAPAPDERLGIPPPDVQQLLDSRGLALPLYYDAHQDAAQQRSRQQWPGLWRLAQAGA